ncbi:Pheromone-regulated membrane protein 10 [Grifola frondosa]|uniref:Pheromone-regulated membrane protein 10 n=1 Tax=Grifola frondosa TaxID=5627 RepID=A0A1C7MRK6_GRIFR|nr:Pheromone-regulated membrane protein 10 [Grifola frondosa]
MSPLATSSRLSYSSTVTHAGSSDTGSGKIQRGKENQFIYRYGSKLHAYDREKAPYPSSFDKNVVELQCLDHAMVVASKGSATFINFKKHNNPKRCLDIGTGLGLWVISSAKSWTDCTFVGFDMMNIQVPLDTLERSVAERIEWVHGNLLRTKLPFDNDEFDHVHMEALAFGIPENKWGSLFEELRRVMRPGATIEILEEDAIFPILPRWFTDPLHAHARGPSAHFPDGSERLACPPPFHSDQLSHEHELLEQLYGDVFTNRFINPSPTSSLPGYFTAFFDHVLLPPVLIFPMPPLPPLPPLPGSTVASVAHSETPESAHEPHSLLPPLHVDTSVDFSLSHSPTSTFPTTPVSHKDISRAPSQSSLNPIVERVKSASIASIKSNSDSHSSGSSRTGKRPSVMLFATPEEGTSVGGENAIELIPMDNVAAQDEHSLYMHLYRTVTFVLSLKEAMWDELRVRIESRNQSLKRYGWEDGDYDEDISRAKFEAMVEQYESDMRARISLWHCLVKNGWEYPTRDTLSKAEMIEETRLRQDILEARLSAETEEEEPPCRRVTPRHRSKSSTDYMSIMLPVEKHEPDSLLHRHRLLRYSLKQRDNVSEEHPVLYSFRYIPGSIYDADTYNTANDHVSRPTAMPFQRREDNRDIDGRKYRDYPTPHPRKDSGNDSYFSVDREAKVDMKEPSTRGRSKSVSDRNGFARPPLSSRASSLDSRAQSINPRVERTFSSLEAGEDRSQRKKGRGVVASLIQYGLAGQESCDDRSTLDDRATPKKGLLRRFSISSVFTADGDDPKRQQGPGRRQSLSYRDRCLLRRGQRRAEIVRHVESYVERQKFILRLAKALLSFGAPSHRIESQLLSAAEILDVHAAFVHFPNLIIVTFMDSDTRTSETHFVRAGGRVALTSLHKVHLVYRDVLHDKIGTKEGCEQLKKILQARPLYNIWIRCVFAFICASIICALSFGGSLADMFVSGLSASVLQYLGLNAAAKSSIYANVYEISVSIIVSFIARLLATLPHNIFCYSAISSAGVVLILPGFTILIAALELTSRNIMCGSVRMVYAIIYTLFLGFGLTIGSDFYLLVNPAARRSMAATAMLDSETYHGHILANNASLPLSMLGGTFTFMQAPESGISHVIKGCYRGPSWPWYRQPFPWWTMLFLVPIYSTCSSLANLQTIRSVQLPVMVTFSCAAYAANKGANYLISDRSDIVSAFGALIIGLCGNIYSRLVGGTAFTSMVTGVLFLVPSAIGNGGGLIQNYDSSSAQYSGSFELGIRMIQVAIGVTIGLFVSQIMVYALGRRKNAAHFAF